jgi:hypothetical protein
VEREAEALRRREVTEADRRREAQEERKIGGEASSEDARRELQRLHSQVSYEIK